MEQVYVKLSTKELNPINLVDSDFYEKYFASSRRGSSGHYDEFNFTLRCEMVEFRNIENITDISIEISCYDTNQRDDREIYLYSILDDIIFLNGKYFWNVSENKDFNLAFHNTMRKTIKFKGIPIDGEIIIHCINIRSKDVSPLKIIGQTGYFQ